MTRAAANQAFSKGRLAARGVFREAGSSAASEAGMAKSTLPERTPRNGKKFMRFLVVEPLLLYGKKGFFSRASSSGMGLHTGPLPLHEGTPETRTKMRFLESKLQFSVVEVRLSAKVSILNLRRSDEL